MITKLGKPKTLSMVLALALLLTQVLGVTSVFASQKVKSSKRISNSMNKVMSFAPFSVSAEAYEISADAYEPDNSMEDANSIGIDGTSQSRTITSDFDIDWVKFEATAGQGYKIITSNLLPAYEDDNSMDTVLFLYDSDGNLITYNDDGREGLESQIAFVAEVTGNYYVLVLHYSDWDWDEEGNNIEREDQSALESKTGQYDLAVSIDNTAPVLTSAILYEGDYLELTYDDILNKNSVPVSDGFTIFAKSVESETYEEVPVDSIDIYGDMIGLSLGGYIADDSAVYLNYAIPDVNPIQDLCGNAAVAITEEPVSVEEDTAPRLNNAQVEGNLLSLYYNQKLDQASVPAAVYFAVYAETTEGSEVFEEIPVDNVIITGTYGDTVTLTLHDEVAVDSNVFLFYFVPEVNPIQDLGGIKAEALESQEVSNYTPDLTAPTISTTDPDNEDTDVPVDQIISVNFSEPVWEGINFGEITLKNGGSVVDYTSSVSDNTLLIDPEGNLGNSVTYDVYLPEGAVEDDWGNILESSYSFSFTTTAAPDTTAPVVESSDPQNDAAGVVTNKTITVSFSENVVEGSNFTGIALSAGTTLVNAVNSVNGNALTINPVSNLDSSVAYNVYIPAGAIKDGANNLLASSYNFSFTTKSASSGGGGITIPSPPPAANGDNQAKLPSEAIKTETKGNITTVIPDESQVLNSLNQIPGAKTVVIPVSADSNVISTQVTGSLLTSLSSQAAAIEIQTAKGSYTLPAAEIKVVELASQLGVQAEDVKINIIIAEPTASQKAAAEKYAQQNGLDLVALPVEFKIEAVSGDKKTEISNFGQYVSRTLTLSRSVNSANAVGVIISANGEMIPVPTRFTVINGQNVAVINSKSNSTYTVIENNKTFTDVGSHWAKAEINTLASKLIIKGMTANTYVPENKVTRAQFAALISKALGLKPNAAKAAFSDVKSSDWYAGAVGAAVEAGIIKGYTDGTFKPNANVTREEAAAMIVQALTAAGVDTTITAAETEQNLAQFTDGIKISSWAKTVVAQAVKSGIIKGYDNGSFIPDNKSTRAEAAVMIMKMLGKANLI